MHPKYLAAVIAVGGYLGVVGLVFFYFGYHTKTKPPHYVAKRTNAIAVTLHSSLQTKTRPSKPKKPKPTPKAKPHHTKPKPVTTRKATKPLFRP